eukprot:17066-Rhodomonas_salina.2
MSGTDVVLGPICLRACYAVSGTDLGRMGLPVQHISALLLGLLLLGCTILVWQRLATPGQNPRP